MSQTVITQAFETLKAQEAANGGIVTLDEFVFANVPNLNITDPIDRTEGLPEAAKIVHRQAVSKTGMINSNAVVYSVVLGADVGDFEFNWVGLINKASGVVAMIVHAPLQKKIKTASGQQGNVLTRSFLMEYNGASQQTQIITPADTWQIDFTARLNGVDERIRLENLDTYGQASFINDGFLVSGTSGNYQVKKGAAYIAGLRAELLFDQALATTARPTKIWVDVCWRGTLTSAWAAATKITVADNLADYISGDEQHYVFPIAQILADGSVLDVRRSTPVTQLVKQSREALRRSYAEAGFNLVPGSFKAGGSVYTVSDVLFDEMTGKAWSWCGALPKDVAPDSAIETTGGESANTWFDCSPNISNKPDPHAAVVQAMVDGLPVRICVVGDSITNGTSVNTPFPVRLGEILREWYNNPNIEVIKRGYSGHDTGQVLTEHLPEIIADNADLYLVALGVNDARNDRGISVDQYEQRLRTIYSRLSFAAVSFCSLTDVVGLKASDITNPYAINAYRSRMKHIAQTCGARYIDTYSIMQRYMFNRGDARGRLSRDRLHWNQAGYDLIAECIFMGGFAGVNLEVEPDQFIDNTTAAYRGVNNVLNTLNCPYSVFVKTPEASVSKLFVFNSSRKPSYLLAHFTSHLSEDGVINGQVTVKNSVEPTARTYNLDIANAPGVTTSYISELPVSVCDLAPGLNIITFTTPADKVCRVVGFTVKEYAGSYNNAMREKAKIGNKIYEGFIAQDGNYRNDKFINELPFERMGSNQSNGVDDTVDYPVPYSFCTLAPRAYGETRFRIRGCFGANSRLRIGYQIQSSDADGGWSANYVPMFTMDFWATTTYMVLTAFTGSRITAGSVANPRGDQCIDIITSEAGTQFYVNGNLLWSMAVKLPECDLFISSSHNSLAEGVVIESVAEIGTGVVPNTFVPGEKWFSHMDGKMHIVDKSGLHKTNQYA